MEFKFNLNEVFKHNISKIEHTLLPSDFSGDGRQAQHCASQVAIIVDAMGIASAKAQDLDHPITSAEKMRNTDHTLYLMVDPYDNDSRGTVVGLLKVGVKNLFLFDKTGMVHEKKSLCILDFYIHESKQRTGLGKKLYDYMLKDKDIEPCKLAIDKPSENFLSFLYKHYGLSKIFPQNNNFVLYEGFFSVKSDTDVSMESVDSHGTVDRIEKDDRNCYDNHSVRSDEYKPKLFGRHTAFKLPDTMDMFHQSKQAYVDVQATPETAERGGGDDVGPEQAEEELQQSQLSAVADHAEDAEPSQCPEQVSPPLVRKHFDQHQHTSFW